MSIIYSLMNCRNNKSPVGNFGGADCMMPKVLVLKAPRCHTM